jgi:hypothetical protein
MRSLGVEPQNGSPFSGGLRNRLRLGLVVDDAELFVVNNVHEVVTVILNAKVA